MIHIPMAKPSMTKAETDAVAEVFESGWLGEGAHTERFEQAVANYTGAPHVVAVNTGTSALHLALLAAGVSPGDEVIVPSFTFAADPVAVRMCGANPVFADIDPETLNLDPGRIGPLITRRTRAIMPTDYGGLPANVKAIRDVVGARDIHIVRDAAHSFGSRISGRPVGVWSGEAATAFSFDPIKNLTCGEGGAILINDAGWADRLRSLRNLGFRHGTYADAAGQKVTDRRVEGDGYRYHMSNINAAIGLAQIKRFPDMANRKRVIARLYDHLLADCPFIRRFTRDYDEIVPFIYPVRIVPSRPSSIITFFADHGIHVGVRYFPCHQQPLFSGSGAEFPETSSLALELLCLPLYADLAEDDVTMIAGLLRRFLESSTLPEPVVRSPSA